MATGVTPTSLTSRLTPDEITNGILAVIGIVISGKTSTSGQSSHPLQFVSTLTHSHDEYAHLSNFLHVQHHFVHTLLQTFKLNMNFGGGIDFDFYLPKGEVVTITDCNGSFSATVLLYNFGTFTYPDPITGFTYTMSMTTNLLFCLASAEWLKLQVCTNTTITGWGIKPIVLPINYAIPLVE